MLRTHHRLPGLLAAIIFATSLFVPPAQGKDDVYIEEKEEHTTWLFWLRPAKKTPTEQFAYAQKLEKKEKLKKAARQYQRLVMFWPDSEEAPEAQLQYATIQQRRGKLDKAFNGYQKLIDDYESEFAYAQILERQFQIAQAIMDKPHGTFGVFSGYTRPQDALEPLRAIVSDGPRWPKAAEAQYLVGWIQEQEKDYDLAIVDYMNTMLRYPESPFAEEAAFARARCLVKLAESTPNDMDAAQEAWYALTLFKATYPESEHIESVEADLKASYKAMAQASYDIAVFYDQNTSKPKAALLAYTTFVNRFPSSEWTPEAQKRIQALSQEVELNGED